MRNLKKYFRIKNYFEYMSVESKITRCLNKFSDSSCRKRCRMVRFLKKNLIYISVDTTIGQNLCLPHPHNIQIGAGVVIGDNVTIYQNVTIGQNHNKYPVIGNNVVIYPNSCVFGDIVIGDNSQIGAGAIVNKSVPKNSVVAGNPAKVVKVIGNNA